MSYTRRRRVIQCCGICNEPGHNRRTCWMKNVTLPRGRSEDIDLDDIEILPIIETPKQGTTQQEDCPICMNSLSGEKNFCVTRCGHKFCSECIIRAARTNNDCPLCRQKLTDHDIEPRPDFTNDEIYALVDDNDYYQETFSQLRDIFTRRQNNSSSGISSDDDIDIMDYDTDDEEEETLAESSTSVRV